MISSTIAGSILGFFGSALGPIAGYFKQKQIGKIKIEEMKYAAELQKAGFTQDQVMYSMTARDDEHARLINHDIEISKGTGFVSAIQKLVRPLITYAFFGLFAAVEISILVKVMESGAEFSDAIQYLWDDETQVMFATVMTFWFGNRVFEKLKDANA